MTDSSTPFTQQQAEAVSIKSGGKELNHCLTCQECVSQCFLSNHYPGMNPREIPLKILEGNIQDLLASEFVWACTLCNRCVADCPKHLKMDNMVRAVRGVAHDLGKGPARLEEGVAKIREVGNSIGIDEEEFVETLQWLGEDAAGEIEGLDEDDFSIPIDKEGAEFLYIPNPREYTSAPNMFSVYLKLFLALDLDWTYASNLRDISNWAYFVGDDETNLWLVRNAVDTAKRLGVKAILATECGHGFKILKQDAEVMMGGPLEFEVLSVVDLAYHSFKEGRLKLRQGAIEETVTYHDPCEVGRKLGCYEAPRELLKFIARKFIEMEPHSKYGVCCGGGGGVLRNEDMGQKRLEFGRSKRDQILATGANIVSTTCQSCLAQLSDLQAHYDLPVKTKTVIELVVESLEE
jgi:Fe-S oxidoreductase